MPVEKKVKKEQKKGFWAGLIDTIDRKMMQSACSSGSCCSGSSKDKGSKCC